MGGNRLLAQFVLLHDHWGHPDNKCIMLDSCSMMETSESLFCAQIIMPDWLWLRCKHQKNAEYKFVDQREMWRAGQQHTYLKKRVQNTFPTILTPALAHSKGRVEMTAANTTIRLQVSSLSYVRIIIFPSSAYITISSTPMVNWYKCTYTVYNILISNPHQHIISMGQNVGYMQLWDYMWMRGWVSKWAISVKPPLCMVSLNNPVSSGECLRNPSLLGQTGRRWDRVRESKN